MIGSTWVVVPAGGQGVRMGAKKQGLRLRGRTVLRWTLEALGAAAVEGIIVAVPAEDLAAWRRRLRGAPRLAAVVAGGVERQASVAAGLQAVPAEAGLVVVHDGVRPCVTADLLARVLEAAREHGAAIAALPVAETVKREAEGFVAETLDRRGLWAVQTPQAFRADLFREAHRRAAADGVLGTDDAVLVERLGVRVRLVPGLPDNIKITRPDDLGLAIRLLAGRRRPVGHPA
jgi:2-C-methyl-D-erythritol 4-phosphate cytidylyltransferase